MSCWLETLLFKKKNGVHVRRFRCVDHRPLNVRAEERFFSLHARLTEDEVKCDFGIIFYYHLYFLLEFTKFLFSNKISNSFFSFIKKLKS
jgi:hypothetical protein